MERMHDRMGRRAREEAYLTGVERQMATEYESARQGKYHEELDGVILQQRELLAELDGIGFVEMVNEMIAPAVIEPPLTSTEKEEDDKLKHEQLKQKVDNAFKVLNTDVVSLEKVIPRQELQANMDRMHALDNAEWFAKILKPTMLEDGSPNPTLVIELRKRKVQSALFPNQVEKVFISYSSDKNLVIAGEKEEFDGVVEMDNFDEDAIYNGFADALNHPMVIGEPPRNNIVPTNFPLRATESTS